jgi:hypothetical protein
MCRIGLARKSLVAGNAKQKKKKKAVDSGNH